MHTVGKVENSRNENLPMGYWSWVNMIIRIPTVCEVVLMENKLSEETSLCSTSGILCFRTRLLVDLEGFLINITMIIR